jgi:hypothetical protein
MERVCGTLKTQLKPCIYPYKNLLLCALGSEQVRQIKQIAHLEDVLHPPPPDERQGRHTDNFKFFARAGLPDHALLPTQTKHELTDTECNKISAILSPVLGVPGRLLHYFEPAKQRVIGWNGCRLSGTGNQMLTKDAVLQSTGGQEDIKPWDCLYIKVH